MVRGRFPTGPHYRKGIMPKLNKPRGPQPLEVPAAKRPADSAKKEAWIVYAESVGVGLAGGTKSDIIAAVDNAA